MSFAGSVARVCVKVIRRLLYHVPHAESRKVGKMKCLGSGFSTLKQHDGRRDRVGGKDEVVFWISWPNLLKGGSWWS